MAGARSANGDDVVNLGDYLKTRLVKVASAPPISSTICTGNAFRRIAALGYSNLVPVIPPGAQLSPHSRLALSLSKGKDTRGKTPGVRNSDGLWTSYNWSANTITPADYDRLHDMGAGVGVIFTPASRLVAFDADTLCEASAYEIMGHIQKEIPGDHVPRVGQAPKFLILLRVTGDEPIAYRRVSFANRAGVLERAELLCANRYANVAAIHPGTGQPYTWSGEAMPAFDALPCVSLAQLDALFAAIAGGLPGGRFETSKPPRSDTSAPAAANSLKGDQARVRKAVMALPNTPEHFPTYDAYVEVGYAIRGASQDWPEAGLELWLDWTELWDNGSNTSAEVHWWSFRDPRVGANWLFEKLETVTGIPLASQWFEPIADEPTDHGQAKPQQFPAMRMVDGLIGPKDIPVREWLIYPWAPNKTVLALVGAAGVSKSAFALRLATAVASGDETVLRGKGHPTSERLHLSGPVFVYNREDDLDEMHRRLEGLRAYYQLPPFAPGTVHLASGVEHRLVIAEKKDRCIVSASGLEWLRDKIRAIRPALVVLDPLISLSTGLEENSNDDMEKLLGLLRALAAGEGTTILVVHHSGKGAEKASGDASALRGASAIVGAIRGGLTLTVQQVRETLSEGPLQGLPPGAYMISEGVKPSYGPKADPVVYHLKVVDVGNGSGAPLPPAAELLFDEKDPAGFLKRRGDTVIIHEKIDTQGARETAKAAAVDRASAEAKAVAAVLDRILGDRSHAPLSTERDRIGEQLAAAGLMRGEGRKAVDGKLSALFCGGPVETESADGKMIRISVRQEDTGQKAPRIIRREVIAHDIFG